MIEFVEELKTPTGRTDNGLLKREGGIIFGCKKDVDLKEYKFLGFDIKSKLIDW